MINKKFAFPSAVLSKMLIQAVQVQGHGIPPLTIGGEPIYLTLEQIYLLTILSAGLLAALLVKVAKIRDKKLVYLILGISIAFLTIDYLIFKFVIYK